MNTVILVIIYSNIDDYIQLYHQTDLKDKILLYFIMNGLINGIRSEAEEKNMLKITC